MKRIFGLLFPLVLLFFSTGSLLAQTTSINGKVSDAEGKPIAGATVKVKNSSTGTTVNNDGVFVIQVPRNATLVISAINFKTKEIAVGEQQTITVQLEQGMDMMDEVVVTALGVKREKRDLTYSSQEIKSAEIEKAKEPNVLNALTGKVSGVQITSATGAPGSSSRIVIRGATSITGDNQALIVVDGIPINNSETGRVNNGPGTNRLADLDPSIIESINVLKGAAATALYGSQGGRGVLMITTKQGAVNRKPVITFSSDFGIDKALLPDLQNKYALGEQYGVYLNGENQKSSSSWGPRVDTLRVNGQPVPTYNVADLFFQTGITTNNTIGVEGGGPASSYLLSYSYFDQKGTVPTSFMKRHSLFAKYNTRITDKLNVNFSINYSANNTNRVPEGYNLESPIWTVFSAPITWNPYPIYEADGVTQRVFRFSRNNPFWVLDNIETKGTVNRFLPTATITFNPLSWLTITERMGADIYAEQVKYYEARSTALNSNGRIVDRLTNFRQFNHDLIANARTRFGNFDLDVIVGNNVLSRYSQAGTGEGVGLSIPGFKNISNASTITYNEGNYTSRKVGFYSQANLGYKNFLNLAVTGRYDGSSVLSSEKNFYSYGSVAAGFVFSELLNGTMKSIFNFGKLRVSYATVGNDGVGAYALNTPFVNQTVGSIQFPYQGLAGFLQSQTLGNESLKNELVKEFEVGLETRTAGNRIGAEVSYFRKKVEDGIIPGVAIAPSTGYTGTTVNSAQMESKGVEVLLTASPIKSRTFNWDASLNFTKIWNEVLFLAPGLTQLGIGFTTAIVGQPYGAFYGQRFARAADGQLLIAADGLPFAASTQGLIGNITADWTAGLNNSFQYKQFRVNFFFDMRKGGDIENNVDGYGYFYGTPKVTEDRGLRVVPGISTVTNRPNDVPVLGREYYRRLNAIREAVIQDGTYIKLRNAGISYDLSPSIVAKTPFKSASLGVTGRNLWIYRPHFTGPDPEASNSFGSDNGDIGTYSFSTPTSRSVTFSLRVSF